MKILIVKDNGLGIALNNAIADACRMALNYEMPQDGSAPEWIELLPAGQVITGRDGRTWINDQPETVLAAFAAEGKDIPIDWEHSSELKAREGEEAPAAAWIKQMEIRDGGSIWGRIEWTVRGAASVSSKEYRYLSPVFAFDIQSRRIMRITSCGLTNQPNLYLDALNRVQTKEESPMDLAQLLAALGLPATTTFAEALNHITKVKGDLATALNAAQSPPLDRFVPRTDYDTALNRATIAETKVKAIEDKILETAINTEIDTALKAGKITPATKDYHIASCRMDGGLERFKAFVAAAPSVAGDSNLDGKDPNKTSTALNAEETKVCEMMGLTVEEYKKANGIK
jgi:phage I-like protein